MRKRRKFSGPLTTVSLCDEQRCSRLLLCSNFLLRFSTETVAHQRRGRASMLPGKCLLAFQDNGAPKRRGGELSATSRRDEAFLHGLVRVSSSVFARVPLFPSFFFSLLPPLPPALPQPRHAEPFASCLAEQRGMLQSCLFPSKLRLGFFGLALKDSP